MVQRIVSPVVSDQVIADLLTEVKPELDIDPESYTRALVALLRPSLEQVVAAHKLAAITQTTEQAFRVFLINLASGG